MGEDKRVRAEKAGGRPSKGSKDGQDGKPKKKFHKDKPKPNGFDARNLDEHSQLIVKVRKLMRERDHARVSGDFSKSDTYRETLADLGVDVRDQKDGPSGWKFLDGRTKKLAAGTQVPDNAMKLKAATKEVPDSKKLKIKKLKKKIEGGETDRNLKNLEGMSTNNNPGQRVVNGVTVEDVKIGSGPECVSGKKVKVHYTGSLTNGRVFDSSIGKRAFTFLLGRGQVIRGWDIGIKGMKVGGSRKLTIPAPLAYGKVGAPPTIPPNSVLKFEVTLLEV
jgi:FKBP-type peptidyl-prolyl cis-trans isomerase